MVDLEGTDPIFKCLNIILETSGLVVSFGTETLELGLKLVGKDGLVFYNVPHFLKLVFVHFSLLILRIFECVEMLMLLALGDGFRVTDLTVLISFESPKASIDSLNFLG